MSLFLEFFRRNFEPFALFCIGDDKSGISASKESLPATTLGLPDHMVGFILVSEPEDEELDCEEVGVAKIDLRELIKAREDLVEKPVDVFRSGHKLNLHSFLFTIKLLSNIFGLLEYRIVLLAIDKMK